ARLNDCVIGTGVTHLGKGDHAQFGRELRAVQTDVAGIRRMGAASLDLAYVAAGRLDGFWERDLKPWDIAAGILLIREAGGFVSDINGAIAIFTHGHTCAGNEAIHKMLLERLKKA